MDDKSSTVLISALGCGFLALVLVGVGFLFFGVRSSTVKVAAGSGGREYGYTIVPGAIEVAEDGSRRATLHFQLTKGWTLEEFELRGEEVRVRSDVDPATLTSPLPTTPITADFDVVYRFDLPEPVEGEARVPRLRIEIEWRATSGFLFGSKSNGGRTLSFVIDEDAGVLRSP